MARRLKIHAGIRNASTYVGKSGSLITTADVGKMHDLGAGPNLPKRSWLREAVERFTAANPKVVSVEEYSAKLKAYIIEGFSTNGHGTWSGSVAKKPYTKKNGDKVVPGGAVNLTDTERLINDIEVWVEWQDV